MQLDAFLRDSDRTVFLNKHLDLVHEGFLCEQGSDYLRVRFVLADQQL